MTGAYELHTGIGSERHATFGAALDRVLVLAASGIESEVRCQGDPLVAGVRSTFGSVCVAEPVTCEWVDIEEEVTHER